MDCGVFFKSIYLFQRYEYMSEYKLHYWHLFSYTFPFFHHLSCSLSRQFMCLINYLSLQGRFFPSGRLSSEITHSTHNGICSYRLSAERPRTHICSWIPQTINNSLLMFKSHFSDKVSTIKRNKLRRRWRGRLSHPGDVRKVFLRVFSRWADSSELAIISGRKLIKVAQSESMGEFAAAQRTDRRTDGKRGVTAMTPLQKRRLAQRQNSRLWSALQCGSPPGLPLSRPSLSSFLFLSLPCYPSIHASPILHPQKNFRGLVFKARPLLPSL